jgi:hypothetical protein
VRAASSRFGAAVVGSHRGILRVEAWRGTELLAAAVPVENGDLSSDDGNAVPHEVTLSVPAGSGREWDPTGDPFHPLAPYGQRLFIRRGIVYADGTEELVGLGWYLITDADPDPLGLGVQVRAASLERLLEDSKLQRPMQPIAGGTFESEVRRLAQGMVPVATKDAALVDRAVPATIVHENNRLEAIGKLAAAWPARIVVDSRGLLRLLPPVPELPGTPVVELHTGARGVVADWQSTAARGDAYNAVFARGEAPSADALPVEGIAWDDDPASPTYYGGPFGERPLEYASPLLTTEAAAQAAAATMLAKRLRRTRIAQVVMVPDPRIELGDFVDVSTPKVTGVGRVAGIRLPLNPDGGPATLTLEMGA